MEGPDNLCGENVECTITFKNVAEIRSDTNPGEGQHQRKASRVANHSSNNHSDSFFGFKSPQRLFSDRRSYSIGSPRRPTAHRTASSLSSPLVASQSFPPAGNPSSTPRSWQPGHSNKRSVSILSIDSEGLPDASPSPHYSRGKPARGHGRSTSLQITPRRNDSYDDSYRKAARAPMRGLPLRESDESALGSLRVDTNNLGGTSRPVSIAESPVDPIEPLRLARRPQLPSFDFKFPAAHSSESNRPAPSPSPKSDRLQSPAKIPRRDPSGLGPPSHQQVTRIISATSVNGSSRSSGEFYSVSDHSSETLASEYTNYSAQGGRAPPPARHARHYSSVAPSSVQPIDSQALLMGYAQISASFTVDGSLVNQSVGFLDDQARPVPNVLARGGGGFWGALKWNAIEESISGLLSNNELDVTSFVDLRLAPGEEQSFSFSFSLPRGLPASHKGKAIKISYNLVIGTQRPSAPNDTQRVNRINIPFRVYSGVNENGDVLGHDLMSPYVLLRDEAKVQKVGPTTPVVAQPKSLSGLWNSAGDFISYVDEILEKRARSNSLFPPAQSSRRSPNRFEIARDGKRIAVVVLNRPVHRIGETIIATVDFGNAAIPCYAVRASLETSEKVVPTLAVRSNASIHRTTRRIHASLFENTLYATRVVFSPAIPTTATPTILTSGVTLDWDLRFEFVTPNILNESGRGPSGTKLLETISSDDRGQVLSALEHLGCESFEISIPLTVYGESVREQLPEESDGYSI
ncbi:hypothetical protein N7454_007701 [Penicillium verhagenii]|nr:hypothetical protein N7454_007701 [Penicillium verhagenii]